MYPTWYCGGTGQSEESPNHWHLAFPTGRARHRYAQALAGESRQTMRAGILRPDVTSGIRMTKTANKYLFAQSIQLFSNYASP